MVIEIPVSWPTMTSWKSAGNGLTDNNLLICEFMSYDCGIKFGLVWQFKTYDVIGDILYNNMTGCLGKILVSISAPMTKRRMR